MQTLTKTKKLIAFFLLLTFGFSNFVSAGIVSHPILKEQFSGEQLVKGIFFAQGQVADKIPEVQKLISEKQVHLNPDQRNQLTKMEDLIIQQISKDYPGAFEYFKKQLQTKDYLAVQKAIEDMSSKIMEASYLYSDKKMSKSEYQQMIKSGNLKPNSGNSATCVTVWFVVNILIAAEIVVAVLAVALAAATNLPSQQTDLQKEFLINAVVTNLSDI